MELVRRYSAKKDYLRRILSKAKAVTAGWGAGWDETRLLSIALPIAIAAWVVEVSRPTKQFAVGVAHDGFHFGEKIGLSRVFLKQPSAFFEKGYILIHGFGQNVLPGVIGAWMGGNSRDIAAALLVINLQTMLSVIFSFFVVFEVAAFISLKYRWRVFLVLTLVYFALHRAVFDLIDRDTLFVIQLYILIRWLRFDASEENRRQRTITWDSFYFILLGLSLPASILYVYDRATYAAVLFVGLFIYLMLTKTRAYAFKRILIFSASAFFSSILLSLSLGFQAIPNSIQHILYWSKFAGLFTALPYPKLAVSLSSLLNWLPILLQSLAFTILCFKFRDQCFSQRRSIRDFAISNSVSIFMLLSAVLFMRVALGRSDEGHLISPGFFSIFAFASVLGSSGLIQYEQAWPQLISGFLAFSLLFNMNSVFAAVNIPGIFEYPFVLSRFSQQPNKALLDPNHLAAVEQIRPDLKGQSCFYSLTSEGIWYRLLSKRPCSRYWYLIYATSRETQQELVQELQQTKPKIILYSNKSIGNLIDGISKETSHLLVHQYVWQHYQPYKLIGDNWFWIRREVEAPVSELLVSSPTPVAGFFDGLTFPEENNWLDVLAGGWLAPPEAQSESPEAQSAGQPTVLLIYNLPEQPQILHLLGVGRASSQRPDVAKAINRLDAIQSGWSITFNRLNLPKTIVEIRAWAYNPKDAKFHAFPQTQTLRPEK